MASKAQQTVTVQFQAKGEQPLINAIINLCRSIQIMSCLYNRLQKGIIKKKKKINSFLSI